MPKILFASKTDGTAPVVAAALAKKIGGDRFFVCAGSKSGEFDREKTADLLAEHGIDEVPELGVLDELNLNDFDLIVCLCQQGENLLKRFPGNPVFISWPICNSYKCTAQELAAVMQRTRDLFEHGYLDALVTSKQQSELVLESLKEGILAHDLRRRIFLFNKAAEQITGYSREEVLGKDCHEVFPGKFCGEKCSFCHTAFDDLEILRTEYSVSLTSKNGQKRTINMRISPLHDEQGQTYGVVATFADITEELNLKRRLLASGSFHGMIGKDPVMQDLFSTIEDVATSDLPVLIQGESGTGKELVASLIHQLGPRKDKLFVPVNCGAIPDNLLESELFGHEKGAFTGALRQKKGRFELAHGGTLFLDEIGDLPLAMQVKLLRVLQDGSFIRVGGETLVRTDARILAATNKDLKKEVQKGTFREDLYYRICVFPITVPPLRERKSDIPLLANHFLENATASYGRKRPECAISSDAMALLISYDWPGNVRELENAIQYALLKCKGRLIEPSHLPENISHDVQKRIITLPLSVSARKTLASKKKGRRPKPITVEMVKNALKATDNNRKKASEILGISRATLYRFMERHGI